MGWKFQSTRPRGARLNVYDEIIIQDRFQSTRPRGARPSWSYWSCSASSFNPRAHVGRDALMTTPIT